MKSFHVGLGAASLVLMLTTMTTAQVMPEYSVSRSSNKAALTVSSGSFRFEEVLSPSTFAFTIEFARDRVEIAGDHHGELVVIRGDRKHMLNMAVASDVHRREVRVLLDDSPALDELARVAEVARKADSKYATFLENANALVRTVQGDVRATGDLVAQAMVQSAGGFKTVAQRGTRADDCWDGYTRAVIRYTYELEACIQEARSRFNPVATAWCGYEYNIKATLAGYWLLDCNGIG